MNKIITNYNHTDLSIQIRAKKEILLSSNTNQKQPGVLNNWEYMIKFSKILNINHNRKIKILDIRQ